MVAARKDGAIAVMYEQGNFYAPNENSDTSSGAPDKHDRKERTPLKDIHAFRSGLLALAKVPGIGVHTIRHLIEHYGSLDAIWDDELSALIAILKNYKVKSAETAANLIKSQSARLFDAAHRQLEELENQGITIINSLDSEYPERLLDAPDHPYWLLVQGSLAALQAPLVGIVGTRTPSQNGIQTAMYLTSVMASEGFGVVSGLAEGIDDTAHRTASYYGVPQVGVLGTGIDVVFPASTANTRTEIVARGGAVVTEYLPGDPYADRARFVERDRIQAALCVALLPIESRAKSGTVHTVKFAERYKRPVAGIKRGTTPVENELLLLLLERGHQVLPLETYEQEVELLNWLRGAIGQSRWPSQKFEIEVDLAVVPVLRRVRYLLRNLRLTDGEKEEFRRRLNMLFEVPLAPNGDANGDSGLGS